MARGGDTLCFTVVLLNLLNQYEYHTIFKILIFLLELGPNDAARLHKTWFVEANTGEFKQFILLGEK